MATKKVTFTSLNVGDKFVVDKLDCKKVSALSYEDIQNPILGEFYATPAMVVEVTVTAAPKKVVAKKVVAKKPVAKKKTAKR